MFGKGTIYKEIKKFLNFDKEAAHCGNRPLVKRHELHDLLQIAEMLQFAHISKQIGATRHQKLFYTPAVVC